MATPSSLFVLSISPTSNKLDWDVSAVDGTTYDIKRDVCGGTPVTIATTGADATTYQDDTAEDGVCYDYNVCAHLTASCTGVQSVVTQTCGSGARSKNPESIAMPRAGSEGPTQRDFNDMVRIIDNQLNQENSNQSAQGICVVQGAIVIDCSKGTWFEVKADEDINSISMINCDTPPALIGNSGLLNTICFNIPPNVTRKICGFPENLCFDGDECQMTPIVTGDAGAQYCLKFKRTVVGPVIKVEDGMGDPRCIPLTLVCSPSSCQITCPNGVVLLTAAGGQPPYEWATTGGVLSADHGESVTLRPFTNTAAPGLGIYSIHKRFRVNVNPGTTNNCDDYWLGLTFDCFGTIVSPTNGDCTGFSGQHFFTNPGTFACGDEGSIDICTNITATLGGGGTPCSNNPGECGDTPSPFNFPNFAENACNAFIADQTGARVCRTAGLGCDHPCALDMDGVVVTVTDSAGTSVSVVITVA